MVLGVSWVIIDNSNMEATFNILLFIINIHSAHTFTIIIISKLKMFCLLHDYRF